MDSDKTLNRAIRRATKKGRYAYEDVLGAGSFGTVLKAYDTETGGLVAIKILEFRRSTKNEEETLKSDARKEVEILKQLKHKHIISIKDDFEFQKWRVIPKGLAIVMEYCPNGSLSHVLQEIVREGKSLSKENRLSWYKQLISALAYIHSKSIAHRDIKPENILVDGNRQLKIADVGISKVLHTEEVCTSSLYMKTLLGTYPFMAPEVFENHYTIKSDVFSMGLVMFVICELPPNLIPQVELDELGEAHTAASFADDSLGNYYYTNGFCGDSLGNYYYTNEFSSKATEALTMCRGLADEKRLFDEMLHPEYHERPTAEDVLNKLKQIEQDRERKRRRNKWSVWLWSVISVIFMFCVYAHFLFSP